MQGSQVCIGCETHKSHFYTLSHHRLLFLIHLRKKPELKMLQHKKRRQSWWLTHLAECLWAASAALCSERDAGGGEQSGKCWRPLTFSHSPRDVYLHTCKYSQNHCTDVVFSFLGWLVLQMMQRLLYVFLGLMDHFSMPIPDQFYHVTEETEKHMNECSFIGNSADIRV